MLVNSTLALGKWEQFVTFEYDEQFMKVKSIKPAAQEIHICWLAFPDLETTPPPK